MRTTLDLDEQLLEEAKQLLGVKTKRETVERALRALIEQERRARLRERLGKIALDLSLEDLDELRQDG